MGKKLSSMSGRVAIVGCGMGGPALATLLARAGAEVTVFERAPALGPIGAGILLQPTGMGVLGHRDHKDALQAKNEIRAEITLRANHRKLRGQRARTAN